MSSFCQEALAVANSIIHPRSFPQMCSAPGPLLLGSPENTSSNGVLSVDHEIASESSSSYRENQSLLFESNNANSIACSQTDQLSVEHRDGNYVEITEGSKSFTNVGNTPMERVVHETSGEKTEQPYTSGKENNTLKEKSHNEAVYPNSELTASGFITSSITTVRAQLSNQERSIKNTNQMPASETLSSKAVVNSPQQLEKMPDSNKNTLGLSEPKQRRIEEDDLNTGKEKQLESNKATFKPNNGHFTVTITENENVTNKVSLFFLSKYLWLCILTKFSNPCRLVKFTFEGTGPSGAVVISSFRSLRSLAV